MKYTRVFGWQEEESEESTTPDQFGEYECQKRHGHVIWVIVTVLVGGLVATLFSLQVALPQPLKSASHSSSCRDPIVRREWRSLSSNEKTEYIKATLCLQQKRSRLGLDHSLYYDFAYVHNYVGNSSHLTGEFLAWHRYLLHTYESALRDKCGLQGYLPYWDWSIDWESFALAPVFHDEDGFGGDGNKSDTSPSIHGFCVTSGPFARLEVPFLEKFSYSHCLSRGFSQDEDGDTTAMLRPSSIEALLKMKNELDFILALEEGPHLSIPRTINGDFSTTTAPVDPLFYLHHGQLDRIWWLWQQQTRKITSGTEDIFRQYQHSGLLHMGGLAPDIPSQDIISTESDILCYRY